MSEQFNQRQLRDAFGQFATGVTVVTTLNAEQKPVGITANSFASVSLSPPLVSWCISNSAKCSDTFRNGNRFAIHILESTQETWSNLFASRSGDPTVFDELNWEIGIHGAPILQGSKVYFECELVHQYEGGDHTILVGEVKDLKAQTIDPLLFFTGQYHSIA